MRKARRYFTNTKSKIRKKKEGHVYKINCSDCEKSYIGQSGRSCSDFYHGIVGELTKEHLCDYKKAKEERNIILEERQKQYDELNNAKTRFKMNDLNI